MFFFSFFDPLSDNDSVGLFGPFFQASGKGIQDWELAVLSYMVRLGWRMELDVTLKLCSFLHGSLSGTTRNGAFSQSKHGVYGLCVISLHCYSETFCATFQDGQLLRNRLFHNSLHKPLFNFLWHVLISFDGSLPAQHGVLMLRNNILHQHYKYTFQASCNCYWRVFWNAVHDAASICGFVVLIMTWFQHVVTKRSSCILTCIRARWKWNKQKGS